MVIKKLFNWLGRPAKQNGISDALWHATIGGLSFFDRLTPEDIKRLRALTESFLAEKEFTSASGLELSDAMCVSIAAQGCLPILNIGLESYRDWLGIIVYPDEFIIPRMVEDEFGVVHEYDDVASGEAWEGGPLLISWHDAQMAGDGYNVVIHEFAHKLDMLNGEADGIPPLHAGMSRQVWSETLHAAFEDFCRLVDVAEDYGRETLLDPYAAEHPGEFFAVMSEAFFESPELLHAEYPELYTQFTLFFRQDPLSVTRGT